MSSFFDLVEQLQSSIDALDQLISGSDVETVNIKGVERATVAKAIKDNFSTLQTMVQGRLTYETKAAMDAAGAPPNGELAEVWNDTAVNNGIYGYSGSWIKSDFDNVQALENSLYRSVLDFDLIQDTDFDMSGANNWVAAIGSPAIAISSGKMSVTFTAGQNESITLPLVSLVHNEEYELSIKARLVSGTASLVQFGGSFSSSPELTEVITFTPTATELEYIGNRVSDINGQLHLGIASGHNNGCVIEFDEIKCVKKNIISKTLSDRIALLELDSVGNTALGNDASMEEPSNWAAQIGSPVLDYATTAGEMTIDFGTGINRSINLPGVLTVNEEYQIRVDLTLVSGTASAITIGNFGSSNTPGNFKVTPNGTKATYKGTITAETVDFGLGIIAAENNGCVVAIDNVYISTPGSRVSELELAVENLEAATFKKLPLTFATDGFMSSLSQYDKPLIKFGVVGDSLMANAVGGAIPGGDDEGAGRRPIRLDVNSVARRIYDLISFNKATHRRLDDSDWSKSGSWVTINDDTVWQPQHPETLYHQSVTANSYIEIVVPDGMENFALICQKDSGFGSLDVTLNGGSIAAYGDSVIDLNRPRLHISDRGNAFYTVEYLNLPAGANTIRISKQNDSTEVRVWGGFYWTGTTLVVHNVARGGHTLIDLIDQHLDAEVKENDFDAILFELTVMNEMSHGRTTAQSVTDLKNILENFVAGKDVAFMSPNPFGDNGSGTNYYQDYQSPSMADTIDGLLQALHDNGTPYIDVFNMFRIKIENRGGTLLGGEGGLYYTTDGQHPNEAGCREWFNLIKPHLTNKAFS